MNLLELYAKLSLDTGEYDKGLDDSKSKAKSAGSFIASTLGKAAVTTAKTVAAAYGTIQAGIAVITKKSLDAYSSYEQLTGGVQTLFGAGGASLEEYAKSIDSTVDDAKDKYKSLMSAQNAVMKAAAGAFKTAGMSANTYMETVTSFSASLIQGLGGDTEAAAKEADKAITDMSDNANKMGSNIQDIQNAYSGFAKQNYTMLDNLRIGYGGTQAEMVRLINDSGILNHTIEDLDGITFDQIVDAIHEVQTNMGITGTTAKEAATTIEGSVNSAKASWENLVTGIADQNQDLSELTSQFIESVEVAASNVLPRILQIFKGIGEAAQDIGPVIAEKLPGVVTEVVPAFFSAGQSMMKAIGSSIVENAPDVIEFGIETLSNLLESGGKDFIETGKDTAVELLKKLSEGLVDGIPTLLENVLPMLEQFTEYIRENAGTVIDAGLDLIKNLAQGLINSLPLLIEYIPQIVINIAEIINENAPKILMAGVDLIVMLVNGIIQAIPTLVENIPKIIEAIISVWTAFNWLNLGKNVLDGVINGIKSLPSKAKGIIKNAVSNIKSTFTGGGIESVVSRIFSNVKNFITSPIKNAIATVKSTVATVTNPFETTFTKAFNIVKGAIDKIKGVFKFSWSLPHLKLPHLSITGKFGLTPPSVPHFSIEWYKKAMDNAMILNDATIFGASGGHLLGGGEAGNEVVAGEAHLMDMIREASAEGSNDVLEAILSELIKLNNGLYDKIVNALRSMNIKFDERELARLVKKYA